MRSSRIIRAPDRYSPWLHYWLETDEGEPEFFDEVLHGEDSTKWEQAMDDEMNSPEKKKYVGVDRVRKDSYVEQMGVQNQG